MLTAAASLSIPHVAPSPNFGILTLDTSSSGSLYHSGTGSITVTNGDIDVNSASSTGAADSGTGNVSANNIYVHGNLSTSGTGKFLGTLHTAASVFVDPLATLPQPTAPSTTFASVNINGTTATLSPGTYLGRITISGNAHVTLQPGLYYLTGGLSITGGTVTGTGVTIFDTSNSSVLIGGTSSVTLSAPTSGAYQGIVLFQSRTDIRPIIISGSAAVALTGEVYAPDAQLELTSTGSTTIRGNGSTINGALIVQDLNVAGSGSLTVVANVSGLSGDLSITKTDNLGGSSITTAEGLATAGGSIVYTITVSNTGPSAAFGATVSEAFPTSITGDTYTVATTGGAKDITHTSGSGAISDIVNLPSCSTITYTVTATINSLATGLITNAASVAAPATFVDTCTPNNTASLTDSLYKADLAITDTDTKTSAVPGTQDVYTIVVTNNGPNAVTGATVKDLLAANADITSDTFTVATTGGATDSTNASSGSDSICDTVNMASGSTITYTVTANICAAVTGSLVNTATVATPSNVAELVPANNTATDTDTLTPQVDLLVTTTDNDSGNVVPGTQVTYTIAVRNSGPSDAVGVTLADALPAGVTSDTYTAVGTTGASGFTASGSGSIDDASVNLVAGSCITYTVTANASAAATGTLINTATAKAGTGETNTNPNQVSGTTSATDTDTLTPQVDLVVTKTDNGGGSSVGSGTTGNVVPGSPVTYTITVQNTGPSNAVGVTVADAFPANIASDTYTAVGTTGASGFTAYGSGSIDDTSVNLAAGSTVTYTVTANVKPTATGRLANSATATAGTGETNTNPAQSAGTTSALDCDTLTPQADLVVTEIDNGGGHIVPGQAMRYTITVQNVGPSDASGVTVADTLPTSISSDTYTASGTTGASGFTASGSGAIDDTSVDLAAGSSITYTVTANVKATVTGTLTNTATAAVGTGETNTNSGQSAGATSATDVDTLTPLIDLVVTKIDSGFGNAVPGSQLVYVITVTNAGPSNAVGLTVADTMPADIASDTYTATGTTGASGFTASGSGSIDDTSVDLTAGSSVTYLVMASISSSATGTLSNTATATAGTGETNIFPNEIDGATSATSTDTLSPQANLVVTNSDNGGGIGSSNGGGATGNVVPGDTVTYTITVQNNGPSDAVGAAVADSLPAGVTSDTYTAVGTTGASGFTASGSGSIDDTDVNLATGSSITYTVTANIDPTATGSLSNTATATAGGTVSATDNDSLTPQVDLAVTNSDDGGGSSADGGTTGSVVPGDTVTYTITVQNNGPSNAVGAAVADSLPAGITSDTYTAVGSTGASGFTASGSGNISDTSVNLASGASITYTVTANIDPAATATLSNTATATAGTGETNTDLSASVGTTSATDSDSLAPQVDLVVTKTDDGGGSSAGSGTIGSVSQGATVTYTITVQNTGPSNATGVVIADALPGGITSDSFAASGSTGTSGFTASGSGNINDTAVNLAAGASVTYTVTANISVTVTGTLSNTVLATVGNGETNTNPSQSGGITSATDSDTISLSVLEDA